MRILTHLVIPVRTVVGLGPGTFGPGRRVPVTVSARCPGGPRGTRAGSCVAVRALEAVEDEARPRRPEPLAGSPLGQSREMFAPCGNCTRQSVLFLATQSQVRSVRGGASSGRLWKSSVRSDFILQRKATPWSVHPPSEPSGPGDSCNSWRRDSSASRASP